MLPYILFSVFIGALVMAYLQLRYSVNNGPTSQKIKDIKAKKKALHEALHEYVQHNKK
jgi:hypothetical protein